MVSIMKALGVQWAVVLVFALFLPNLVLAVPGDLNGDGVLDVRDLRLMHEQRLALNPGTMGNADLNRDLRIDAADFRMLGQAIGGQAVIFNVEGSTIDPMQLEVVGRNLTAAAITNFSINGVIVPPASLSEITEAGVVTRLRFPVPVGASNGAATLSLNGQVINIPFVRLPIAVTASVSASTLNEGNASTLTLTLSQAAQEEIRIDVNAVEQTARTADFSISQTTVTIMAGMTTGSSIISTVADGSSENDETFQVNVVNARRVLSGQDSNESIGFAGTTSFPITIRQNDDIFDFDGDGIGDSAFSAPSADGPGGIDVGFVNVLYGSNTLNTTVNTRPATLSGTGLGFSIIGDQLRGALGTALSTGDVDGDGCSDLIIGMQFGDPNGVVDAGQVFVVYGRSAAAGGRLTGSQLTSALVTSGQALNITGDVANDAIGTAVTGTDFDADGCVDIVFSAPVADNTAGVNTENGKVFVVYGRNVAQGGRLTGNQTLSSVLAGNNGLTLRGNNNEFQGQSLSGGDFDGDGCEDLVIGSTLVSRTLMGNGITTVVYGQAASGRRTGVVDLTSLVTANSACEFSGIDAADQLGVALTCRDLDNDGIDDLVVGATGADPNYVSNAGEIYVVYGRGAANRYAGSVSLSSLSGTQILTLTNNEGNKSFGTQITVGDVDGDGFRDLILGVPDGNNFVTVGGYVFVVYSTTTRRSGTLAVNPEVTANRAAQINGTGFFQNFGFVSISDLNGDGQHDLIIGMPNRNVLGFGRGACFVFLGRSASAGGRLVGMLVSDTIAGTNQGFRIDGNGNVDFLGRPITGR